MHSPDLVDANVTRIAELFPACVTESRDDKGKVSLSNTPGCVARTHAEAVQSVGTCYAAR